ncbi:pyrazinamidase/nicotinamidase [Aspergillus campestris IBT 28561]|uniref:Pyrazinamidase/nicotinamidase n=1 Tax=Aspergillus campestris (strain IBT 28561) TaxID=1392248 RepID=A0A2I1CR06_ASPC2|nr:pyrazinamidase/nicotinamidase [Aspergillus campestris IBT 28561]PKY00056.1 pyrazinamidase/nicotinamidase [Aspergillus campestris IBT 28561]
MSSSAPSFRSLIGLPPSTASVQDSTLIIVDAQNEYASGLLQVKHVDASRKAIAELLSRYRHNGDGKNIVHVVHQVPAGAPVFTPDTALAEEFAELTPNAGEKVVKKQHPNAFGQTDLHEYLGGLGARGKKIVLVGYMAHICISTTARAGSELGYDIVVAQDGVGDRDIPGVDADQLVAVVMKELADGFGTVVSVADISA